MMDNDSRQTRDRLSSNVTYTTREKYRFRRMCEEKVIPSFIQCKCVVQHERANVRNCGRNITIFWEKNKLYSDHLNRLFTFKIKSIVKVWKHLLKCTIIVL